MRQVPYLIIGSGRMAKHMQCYLDLLHIPYRAWSRQYNTPEELKTLSLHSDIILLLIKDSAITYFIEQHSFLKDKKLVHFSGNLLLPGVWGAHPLMTFMPSLYDLECYRKMPFILQENSPELSDLLPGLNNPYYKIPNKMRSYYHAMCVIGGNFTTLIWQKFFDELEQRLGLPKEAAYPYLQQIASNLMHHAEYALTGPLIRGDKLTIANHLQALSEDEFKNVYQAFVEMYENKMRTCI
jgi:2-dehydropantoate 2-reductase